MRRALPRSRRRVAPRPPSSHDPENAYSNRCDSSCRGCRHRPSGARIEPEVPDRHVGLGLRRPRVRWGSGRRGRASDPAITVMSTIAPSSVGSAITVGVSWLHSMVKYGSTILSAAGRFSQIWNSSSGFGPSLVEQREHLAVHDAAAGGHPLRVAAAEAGGRAERVAVVAEPGAHVGDGLEPTMGMLREAGHGRAVVHVPAVDAGEVHADVAAAERGVGAEVVGACRVVVSVMGAEQERIDRRPLRTEWERLQQRIGHHAMVRRDHCDRNRLPAPSPSEISRKTVAQRPDPDIFRVGERVWVRGRLPGWPALARCLRYPAVRRYLLSTALAAIGLNILVTVLFKQAFDISGDTLSIAFIGLAQFVPAVLLVLVSGWVADRFDRRRVTALFLLARTACAAGFVVYSVVRPGHALAVVLPRVPVRSDRRDDRTVAPLDRPAPRAARALPAGGRAVDGDVHRAAPSSAR